ncbi:MAG: PAS domain S-box protein [Syntrophales bacterium]
MRVEQITEKRIAELMRREAELRFIVDHQTEMICRWRPDTTLTFVNDAYCRYFDKTREGIIGTRFIDRIPAGERAGVSRAVQSCLDRPGVHRREHQSKDANGTIRWQEWIDQPIQGDDGQVREFLSVGRDITDRKELEIHSARTERTLSRLKETAFDLLALSPREELHRFLADRLAGLTGALFVGVNEYDAGTDSLTTRAFSGLPEVAEKFLEMMGQGPIGATYPITSAAARAEIRKGRLVLVPGGLHDLLFGRIPRPLCILAETAFGLGEIYTIGFVHEGRLYGNAVIGLKAGVEADTELIEAYGLLTSLALQRRSAEEEQRQAAATLRRLAEAVDQAAEAICIVDPTGRIEYVNPAFERVSGYGRDEVAGQNPRILKSGVQDAAFYRTLWETVTAGNTWSGRIVNKRKDGLLYTEDCTISPVKDEQGVIEYFVAVKRDVSREIEMEEQFRQSQRLESVGQLAAGVAHDLNNLLSPILGYAELLLLEIDPAGEARGQVEEIVKAGERSRDLIRQLLAFGRRQMLELKVTDLRSVVEGMNGLLSRMIRENVRIETVFAEGPCTALIDRGQVEQVLINLAVNAQDAMPDGGHLTIEVAHAELDDQYCRIHTGVTPGRYVQLTVSDTGQGMDEETRAHMFEPFFTTKGKLGTGLGLATVYGIVKQHGGNIWVYSEKGRGTTFKTYLPASSEGAAREPLPAQTGDLLRGSETVLVVEDNAMVRSLARAILAKQGYRVLIAANGTEALRALAEHAGKIDLLLTDVVMPDMNGKELFARTAQARPGIRVLFMSGYTANVIAHHGVLDEGVSFIQKPFTVHALTAKVREILGAPGNA